MALLGLVLAIMLAVGGDRGITFGGRVAVVEVDGLITDSEELVEQIRDFRRNPSVEAFVVSINSPGGIVAPSQAVYRELRSLREEEDRPVIAAIGSVGASGGYYVALASDSIFALPGSITGSIGVLLEFPNVSGLMEKLGVDMEIVTSAEHKDMGSPFRSMSEEDREILRSLVDDVYDQFIDVVVLERDLDAESVREFSDGRILSGRQAMEVGLVDRMGSLSEAISAAGEMAGLGDDPAVIRPPEEGFGMFDLLFGRGPESKGTLYAVSRTLEELWTPRLKFVAPAATR